MCKMLLFVYFNHLDMKTFNSIFFRSYFTYYVYNVNGFQKADLCIILIILFLE